MDKRVAVAVVVFAVVASVFPALASPAPLPYAPGRLLVQLADAGLLVPAGVKGAALPACLADLLETAPDVDHLVLSPLLPLSTLPAAFRDRDFDHIAVIDGLDPEADMTALARKLVNAHPGVILRAEPDWRGRGSGAPDDPLFDQQWSLENSGDRDIDMVGAYGITMGDASVRVAVLDTGIFAAHPDLAGRLAAQKDFVNGDDDASDDYGHGTNVAGIIAAGANNGLGMAGVCPRCLLVAAKVLDDQNTGYYSWWIQGLAFAVEQGASVINMSLGGSTASDLLHSAVSAARDSGAVVVASMMNDNNDTPYYPAAYPETIAVGATNVNDYRASPFPWGGGSNYGAHIDLVAPGSRIIGPDLLGDYSQWSGTSQAAPHVSGVAALIAGLRPDLSPEDIRELINASAQDQVGKASEDIPGFDIYYGHGRLNAYDALRRAQASESSDGDLDRDTDTVSDREPDADTDVDADTADREKDLSGETGDREVIVISDDGCGSGRTSPGLALLLAALALARNRRRRDGSARN